MVAVVRFARRYLLLNLYDPLGPEHSNLPDRLAGHHHLGGDPFKASGYSPSALVYNLKITCRFMGCSIDPSPL